MRRLIFIAVFAILALGVLVPFGNNRVSADELSPEQIERIKINCVSIKNSLSQLHASDALLRVNRGQVYELMASKLMDTFNNRLSTNRLDSKAMATVTSNYRTALTTFRTDYITYEQKLSSAMRIDCTVNPTAFHATVEQARELRIKVHDDVNKLHRLIDDYRTSVGDFLVNYERVAE
ncbi:MAG: hypothetical protein WAR37_01935 [Candidatus Microsaccharimonas sp.]